MAHYYLSFSMRVYHVYVCGLLRACACIISHNIYIHIYIHTCIHIHAYIYIYIYVHEGKIYSKQIRGLTVYIWPRVTCESDNLVCARVNV